MIQVTKIPHNDQRYDTTGDWIFRDGELIIKVSDMGDHRLEFLIAIHEIIEAILCKQAGIQQSRVDEFDLSYTGKYDEPGNDPGCPYRKQHKFATKIEERIAQKLGVDFKYYETKVHSLYYQKTYSKDKDKDKK